MAKSSEPKTQNFRRILTATRKHIVRNKWLSIASIIVISLTFIIATSMIGLVIISSRTISAFEKKAQVMIFFENDSAEEDILSLQDELEQLDMTESVEYISKEEALEIYKEDFEDDEALVESVTSDALPPSLGIRAKNIDEIPDIIKYCNKLKENSDNNIEEIMYFKDVIDTLRGISRVIRIGGGILVAALSAISIVLILITIGFNINAHKSEIEVMQLVGSTNNYIRIPFLLEGAFYGFVGSAISISILLLIWYGSIYLIQNNELFIFISQTFKEIGMSYLKEFNFIFIGSTIVAEIAAGTIIGSASSLIAIWKYLK
ncbi:FtsX-like permease family protein [Candidatus Dojkabacteria bacterium]|nr:FtsX-like permease family protein [Candidatus Dojkabacteria bacterium]